MRRFTASHKTMCGCTECVGLHTLHRSLLAKRGVMARQIAIDKQRRTTKARAEEMARGWGEVELHPKPPDAIRAGTCARWSANDIPHWDCQTLQCAECKEYPVPAEEARGTRCLEAQMSLMIKEGEVGAVGTTDKAAMGYYIVQWKSE